MTTDNDTVDMARLDYELIYQEVLALCPSMGNIIKYVRQVRPAQRGEYATCLASIVHHSENEAQARQRLLDIYLRYAVKESFYYHNRYNTVDIEDAFQVACVGILLAIEKYNFNVKGCFSSYVSQWIRQVLNRYLMPYGHSLHVPVHYSAQVTKLCHELDYDFDGSDLTQYDFNDILEFFRRNSVHSKKQDEQRALCAVRVVRPAESVEDLVQKIADDEEFSMNEWILSDPEDCYEDLLEQSVTGYVTDCVQAGLQSLTERERDIWLHRMGFDGLPEMTLEELGRKYGVTRERVRQIEKKAKRKFVEYVKKHPFLNEDEQPYDVSVVGI